MENLEKLAVKIYKAMFEGKKSVVIEGKKYSVLRTSTTGLRVVYAEDMRFIEQNPEKASHWASMAREGHKIMWVIKDGHYVAQVRDAKFHDFTSRSLRKAKNSKKP